MPLRHESPTPLRPRCSGIEPNGVLRQTRRMRRRPPPRLRMLSLLPGLLFLSPLGAATPARDDVVKMETMKVSAGGYEEFVPSWVFDAKPPALVLRRAESVKSPPSFPIWLIPARLEVKDGDHITAVNGRKATEPDFFAHWKSVQQDGTALVLEVRAGGTGRARKVEFNLATKPPPPATKSATTK